MDAEEKALVKALLDKDAIVAGGVLYCAPVMLRAATALTAALADKEKLDSLQVCAYSVLQQADEHIKNSLKIDLEHAIDAARRSHG